MPLHFHLLFYLMPTPAVEVADVNKNSLGFQECRKQGLSSLQLAQDFEIGVQDDVTRVSSSTVIVSCSLL